MSNEEDRFADWMRREVAEYNRLPEPAPEAIAGMWERIEGPVREVVSAHRSSARGPSALEGRRAAAAGGGARPWRARAPWGAGVAAALVLGVGIGRVTAPRAAEGGGVRTDTLVIASRDTVGTSMTVAPAAVVDHLARTVVFLASFREDARTGAVDGDVRDRGRDLLTATQILMDSPAAAGDPAMRALLEDLELVLAQIAQLNQRRGAEEARIASDAMKQRDILPRLRTVVPQEALDATVAAASSGN